MSLMFWISWIRYSSSAVTHSAFLLSTVMFWDLSDSCRPESSSSTSLSPFLTLTPGSTTHLIVVELVLPLLPERTVQMMSLFLADSREPRSTIVSLSFSLRTVQVGPVKRVLPQT